MTHQLILWRIRSARIAWLSSMVVLLLQRTPVLRVLASSEFAVGVRLGEMLRALVPIALAAGAVDTLTGATGLVTNPVSPANAEVGTTFTMVFAYTGSSATPESYAIFGVMPPGLSVPNATGPAGNLTLNRTSGSIQGIPTTAGSFTIEIQAFDATNRGGGTFGSSDRIPVTIVVQSVEVAPSFSLHPSSTTVAFGANATFTVTVAGTPAPTVQWRKGGSPIAGATSTTLTLNSVTLLSEGSYDCVATNSVNSVTSNPATLTVTPPAAPAITSQPVPLTSRQGSGAFFSAQASGVSLSYQWRKDGVDLPGETQPTLFLNNVQSAAQGAYSIRVVNPGGSAVSDAAPLTVVSTGSARLVNLSARALVGSGDGILIPGFVISGQGSKTLLVRAAGPRLGMIPFNVPGVLADPAMSVNSDGTVVASNDDWGLFADQTLLADATASSGAFSLSGSTKDAALVVTLPAKPYTVPTSGVGGATGVAIIELYDLDAPSSSARLANISARAQVGTGDNLLIPGFVIEGDVAMTLLIRAVGPTLGNVPYNVSGVIQDPVMTIFRGPEAIAANDDWEQAPNQAALVAATSATGAFTLGAGQKDAAFLVALKPGAYTVQVAGKNGATGVALMELYVVGP